MTSWTTDIRPEIRSIGPRISIAAGGNGAGAKCSDELGRMGAVTLVPEMNERIAS